MFGCFMSIFGRLCNSWESIVVLFIEWSLYGSEPLNNAILDVLESFWSHDLNCSQRKELKWPFMSVVATSE